MSEERQGGLVERDDELARLDAAIERASGGEGSFVAIEGPAGIGKSRLLAEARERAAGDGMLMLAARASELERDFAYGLTRQLFERPLREASAAARKRLLDEAAELAAPAIGFGSGAEPAAGDASFGVVHGLYWLVSNLAAEQPLVLVVDDLHWADAPSLRFLSHLVGRLEGLPVLVAGAARPAEPDADPLVGRLLADPAAEALRPAPLSAEGVGAMLERGGESAEPEFVAACHAATGGNPFLLEELADALRADGVPPTAAGAERVRELGPATVSRSVLLRLARLPAAAAGLARAVAVLVPGSEMRAAGELAGLDSEEAASAADALADVHILARERPLDFIHPVVRHAVYDELPPSERAAMHARAAGILREQGAGADALAPHLLATDPAGDAEVVAALRSAAGGALEQGAAELAARYLARALAEPPEPDERADVLGELGWAEWLCADRPADAIAHLREALDMTEDPAERAAAVMTLARATFTSGDVPGGYDILEQGIAELTGKVGEETVLRLEAELASIGLTHPPTAPRAIDRLEGFVGIEGASPAELLQVANLAAWKWIDGSADETAKLAEQALAGDALLESEGSDSVMVYEAIWALTWSDRTERAAEALKATAAAGRRTGSVFGIGTSYAVRTILAWHEGDLKTCEAEARSGIAIPGFPAFSWPPIHAFLALALIERDELEEAERLLELSGVGPGLPELVHFNGAFYARGQLRLHQGRIEEALEDFRELGARDERLEVVNPSIPWRCGCVEALVRLDRSEEAVELADAHMELARRWGTASATGVALWAQGLARGGDGIELLAEAAETLAQSPARLDEAYALVDLGSATRRDGRRAEAREPLRQGLDLARRCGATGLAERAHAELVAAGAKPRRLQFSGLESLTASERRVAAMAAEGLTNRQIAQDLFVTAKTVENHLTRVYSKLDINSRGDLGEALAAPA